MVVASQLRAGMAIKFQGQDYKVVAAEYHPGQGQMGGATHARLQSLNTGTFWEHSFRADLKLDELPVEKHPLDFLYTDAGHCCFMHPENYEQSEIPKEIVGPQAEFLEPGMRLAVEFVEGRPISRALSGRVGGRDRGDGAPDAPAAGHQFQAGPAGERCFRAGSPVRQGGRPDPPGPADAPLHGPGPRPASVGGSSLPSCLRLSAPRGLEGSQTYIMGGFYRRLD